MVMSRDGTAGRLGQWGAIALAAVALLGTMFTLGRSVSEVNGKQDRNCRILVQLDQDLRLHILAEAASHRRKRAHDILRDPLAPFPEASC